MEVFFRFIKQEFGFSHFVSRSKKQYKILQRRFITELNELILIDLTIAIWWDIKILKQKFLFYYKHS